MKAAKLIMCWLCSRMPSTITIFFDTNDGNSFAFAVIFPLSTNIFIHKMRRELIRHEQYGCGCSSKLCGSFAVGQRNLFNCGNTHLWWPNQKNYARKANISSAPNPHTDSAPEKFRGGGKQLSAFLCDQEMWNGPSHSRYCNKFSQHFHMIEWVSNGTQTQIHPPQLTIVWSLTNRNYE